MHVTLLAVGDEMENEEFFLFVKLSMVDDTKNIKMLNVANTI